MRRLGVGLIVGALGLIVIGPGAYAHANVRSSDPADGQRLEASPESVTITFTEQPEPSLTVVRVLDSSGETWHDGSAEVLADDPFTASVALKELPEGSYTVTWRTVSRADGHTTAGAFAFGVGVKPSAAVVPTESGTEEAESPPPSVLEIAGRWGLLLGLVALLGATSVGAVVLRDSPPAVRRLAAVAVTVAAVGLLLFGEAQRRAAGTDLAALFQTRAGEALIYRGVLIALAAGALIGARSERARGALLWVAVGATAGTMLAHVDAGHASADPSWAWAQVAAQSVHFASAGIWLGGLGALLLGIRGVRGEERGRAVRRFSAMAGIMLGAVIVTGTLRAIDQLDTWSDLFSSGYGRLILTKIGLVLILAALGAINRYVNVPKSDSSVSGLRRVSRVELGVAAATLFAAAALASVSPPHVEPARAAEPEQLIVAGSDFATSVRVRVQIDPGYAGSNAFTVRIEDYDSGEPVQADRVSLRFAFVDDPSVAPSQLELNSADPGTYRAEGANLSLEGVWRTAVVVERGADSVEVPLEFGTRCRARELREPGLATVYEIELLHGLTAQGYADPGVDGHHDVHLTFMSGGEEAHIMRKPTMRATPRGEESQELDLKRLSHGHFVATPHLDAGVWRFDFEAAMAGHTLRGCFEQTIDG